MTDNDELCLSIGRALQAACEQYEVPPDALKRLIAPQGNETLAAITLLIGADHTECSRSSLVQVPGHPFRGTPPSVPDPANVILVPDMDATALTAFAEKQCKLTYLEGNYKKWDYLIGLNKKPISGRGKKFEVLTWKPGRNVSSDEVRKHVQKKGFSGHTAAFTAWVAQHSPEGCHASIPEDNACWSDSGGRLYVPFSYFDGGDRRLRRYWLDGGWDDDWVFVAFREL